MTTRGSNEPKPFDAARGGAGRSETRVETVADAPLRPMFPAAAMPPAAADARRESWFSVATVLILIAGYAAAAAAVAATYGPVFTQPVMGP